MITPVRGSDELVASCRDPYTRLISDQAFELSVCEKLEKFATAVTQIREYHFALPLCITTFHTFVIDTLSAHRFTPVLELLACIKAATTFVFPWCGRAPFRCPSRAAPPVRRGLRLHLRNNTIHRNPTNYSRIFLFLYMMKNKSGQNKGTVQFYRGSVSWYMRSL